ncbi:DEKNAAC101135 [Brettanomyces naardenensis]|uniref:Chromatin modification-related protein EAF6 n=1 Tax=Brettanomyces naardenensis TaxID=13370 RepID=A0A448YH79_BRENA|nr:DEKNAAC101135 [Brettanomyces naardenensis]
MTAEAKNGTSTEGQSAAAAGSSKKAEYDALKKKLKESIAKRNNLDDELTKIEENIFSKETQYLADGTTHGNIIKGFENFSKTNSSSSTRVKKIQFTDEDRIFSLSSSTYVTQLRKLQAGGDGGGFNTSTASLEEEDEPSSDFSTPRKKR